MQITSTQDLAAAVRGRRQESGLSQAQLAINAGVSRDWINQIEAGKPTAEFGLIIRLLEALELRLELVARKQNSEASRGSVDLDNLLDEYRDR
jgi:HTH-type transcriptional regulator / antitoxin HipB